MLAAVARRRTGRWAMAAALLVIVSAGTILLVGAVLGGGPSEVDGTADLRSLPRFGEMVRRVDRAVRHRADDNAPEATEIGRHRGRRVGRRSAARRVGHRSGQRRPRSDRAAAGR